MSALSVRRFAAGSVAAPTTGLDAQLIAGLTRLVEVRPSRGFGKCRTLLRREQP